MATLQGIRIGYRREATDHREDRDNQTRQGHDRHNVPAQKAVKHQASSVEMEGHFSHDTDDQHQCREEHPGRTVVPHFEECRDREDSILEDSIL